jgi:protein-disulfide isomerase
MRCSPAALLAIWLLGLAACQGRADGDAQFGARVKAWMMSHPDDLRAALENMQTKGDQQAAQAEAQADVTAVAALPKLRTALERDPRDFVANPGGRITVTEFYDYRCPHCINIAPKVVDLIRSHPDVRFVFKEMPIFGPVSEHAARAALAAKAEGKDYVGLYAAMMAAHPLTDEAIDQLASARGVSTTAIDSPPAISHDDAQMADTMRLAGRLSIDGTPGFVVGDTIIHGEDYEGLTAAIEKAGG